MPRERLHAHDLAALRVALDQHACDTGAFYRQTIGHDARDIRAREAPGAGPQRDLDVLRALGHADAHALDAQAEGSRRIAQRTGQNARGLFELLRAQLALSERNKRPAARMHAQGEAPGNVLPHLELDLVAVVPLLGTRNACANEGVCCLVTIFRDARERVDYRLALPEKLLLIGKVRPRTSAAASRRGKRARRRDAVGRRFDELVDLAFHEALFVFRNAREHGVARQRAGNKRCAPILQVRNAIPAIGEGFDCYLFSLHALHDSGTRGAGAQALQGF